ncbi:peptidylprolyl isomerase [uncultured Ruminococcus sp.]|uniref:peptidylprolyl isomerase n=1 Tax=uncultured Ruminococcus sp. TaxID=165186 RepID=UPI0025D8A2CE|nr:peptidylprolyl isomerase [uncultured Ruminococcus sp.]
MEKKVKIEMENGKEILVELYPETAPITVANFVKLVGEGFYDGLIFHRVIKDFMIQGGDPEGTGMGGSKEHIKGEFSTNGVKNDLKHTRGVISMARSMMPDSASSQFFIMHKDAPYLDGKYAAFGKVIEGMDTVDEIACVNVDFNDKPLQPQVMKKVTLVD